MFDLFLYTTAVSAVLPQFKYYTTISYPEPAIFGEESRAQFEKIRELWDNP